MKVKEGMGKIGCLITSSRLRERIDGGMEIWEEATQIYGLKHTKHKMGKVSGASQLSTTRIHKMSTK